MLNHIKAIIQYILPKQFLTVCFGWLASKRLGIITTLLIKGFIKLYRVNMKEAVYAKAEDYATFNDFFARELNEDARTIDDGDDTIIMPADGMISQFGTITGNQLLQAKGHVYSLESLVACNPTMIDAFENGKYITTYLAPSNYHRVHMPCAATLREMIYVPGSLFSVNIATTEHIPNIFARNERLICLFDTEFGPMVQILVGATIVGSIETAWEGVITPPRDGIMKRWTYENNPITFSKGQQMGCFKLGSTVINLFPHNVVFDTAIKSGTVARMGQKMANNA